MSIIDDLFLLKLNTPKDIIDNMIEDDNLELFFRLKYEFEKINPTYLCISDKKMNNPSNTKYFVEKCFISKKLPINLIMNLIQDHYVTDFNYYVNKCYEKYKDKIDLTDNQKLIITSSCGNFLLLGQSNLLETKVKEQIIDEYNKYIESFKGKISNKITNNEYQDNMFIDSQNKLYLEWKIELLSFVALLFAFSNDD